MKVDPSALSFRHPCHDSPLSPGLGHAADAAVLCRGGPAAGPGSVRLLQSGLPLQQGRAGGLRPVLTRHLHRVQPEDRQQPSPCVRQAHRDRGLLPLLQGKG